MHKPLNIKKFILTSYLPKRILKHIGTDKHKYLSNAVLNCLRKDMDVFKTLTAKAKPLRYTPSQLADLITAAQHADKQAILSLCIAFTPLILRETHYPRIKDSLKEEAVNTAWEIFLKFIYKYNGNDYRHLPGLLQCHLRYELLHRAMSQQHNAKESSLEEDTLALEHSPMDNVASSMALKEELAKLSPKEKLVIEYCYGQELTQEAAAQKLHCTVRSIRRYHTSALNKLRQSLSTLS